MPLKPSLDIPMLLVVAADRATFGGEDQVMLPPPLSDVLAAHRAVAGSTSLEEPPMLEGAVLLRAALHYHEPGCEAALRRSLIEITGPLRLDVALVSSALMSSPKSLVAFDADSTLVDGEGIDELARRAGAEEQVAAITARAMAGELDYAESLRARVRLLAGLRASDLEAAACELRLQRGALQTVAALRARGVFVAVLSGGFAFYLEEIRRRLAVDVVQGNRLRLVQDELDGTVIPPILDAEGKARNLREFLRRRNLRSAHCVAVGDGANDRPMLECSGIALGFAPKRALWSTLHGALWRGDLRSVLALGGWTLRDPR